MVIAVIPSRFSSTRFPGKALASIKGLPLIVRVARRVRESQVADRVLVATDDSRIARRIAAEGIEVWMSQEKFRTGSDRVAAAVREMDADTILNVQGDEPLVDRSMLQGALDALGGNDIGTVAAPMSDLSFLEDKDAVKVQIGGDGRARAFSRQAFLDPCYVHLGIYSFSRDSLKRFSLLPTGKNEQICSLEQLRALENGMTIGVRLVQSVHAAVNRPEDIQRIESML